MHPTSPKSLSDVLTACDLILRHTAGRTLDDYRREAFLRAGVERCFEVIGEARRRIERKDPATAAAIPAYRDAIDFRNLLAHGYDTVNHDRVWRYIENDLPALRERVEQLLNEEDQV
jgi:uncharacterized protein with HEPN domain